MNIDISKGWLPDFKGFAMPEGGLVKCQNLLPYDDYYATANEQAVKSAGAVSGTPLSGREFAYTDGVYYGIIGTATKLYRVETNLALTDVSRASGGAYTASENSWDFCQYGSSIIATDYNDVPQILKTFASGANFVALGGTTPPKAKYCIFYNGHLIFGFTNDGTENSKKLVWSAFESIEDWTAALATGCGAQEIADADGQMTGLSTAGTHLLIGFDNSITTGYYSGSPYTLGFNVNMFKGVGVVPGSMVSVGELCYFWDKKEFYVTDGATVKPIGTGVRDTVLAELNIGHPYRVSSAHDPRRGLIMWAYPTTASTTGRPDKILVFNYRKNRWAIVNTDVNCIWNMHTGANLMDDMDATYPDISDMPYPMDSNAWLASSQVIGCVDVDGYLATYTGTPKTGVIETGDLRDKKGNVLQITNVHPLIDSPVDASTVRIGHRMQETESVSYSVSATVGTTSNRAIVRNSGKLLRIELTTGNHSGITGLEADISAQGRR